MIPVLVPVYKPEASFVGFIKELASSLKGLDCPIVVINDGNPRDSGEFEEIGGTGDIVLLSHAVNLGKGRALKTGINFVLCEYPDAEGCVTCDADGQHSVPDIRRVVGELQDRKDELVLGCRDLREGIPLRSRFGNRFTSFIFKILTGISIADTQTGLRGIPATLMRDCVRLEGERYEFETNMLLEAKRSGVGLRQIPIQTIYINKNESSHFNPILDSLRIYRLIIKFLFSSILSCIIDFCLFSLIFFLSGNVALSLVFARIVAVLVNFKVNKDFVFPVQNGKHKAMVFLKYCLLVVFQASIVFWGISYIGKATGVSVYILKIVIESLLFLCSYNIQRDFIFN